MFFSAMRRLVYIYGPAPVDNFIFRLFYRWTVLLLLTFSFIVTCKLLCGDSFECISNNGNTWTMYCYAEGIYSKPASLVPDEDAKQSPEVKNFRRYHTYYPLVNLMFLVQAFVFYLPHLLWKTYERGYVYRLTAGVQEFFDKKETRDLQLCHLAEYFLVTRGKHRRYTGIYFAFEACNCVIAIALTLWLTNFFNVTGVEDFLPNEIASWSDFRHFYFPPKGICDWEQFSSRGDFTRYVALCQLPLNSLFMKMFLFLRAWYILLAVLSGLVLVYRIILLSRFFRVLTMGFSSPLCEKSVLESLCSTSSYSDWFFLSRLSKSMTDIDFPQMIAKISLAFQAKGDTKDLNELSPSGILLNDFDSCNMTSAM